MLPEWAVCVWWWTKINWFVESWKKNLKLPTFIAVPNSKNFYSDTHINDPVFASVIWLFILSNRFDNKGAVFSFDIWWFFSSIKSVFKKILP
jgi:hypothetical protein